MTNFVGDWSNHDWGRGGMDFAAMARDGVAGGWHKTSDGLRFYTDPYWAGAVTRMRAAFPGPVGSYHVLWGNRDIGQQIDWWFSILDATAPGWRTDSRFCLVTDNEPFGYNAAPSVAQVNQAGDIIRQLTGKTMLAYCPPWHYGSALSGLRYPLISSAYGNNPVAAYKAAYPGDGNSRWTAAASPVAVLQYGSQTRMGSQNTCDVNAIRDPNVWGLLVGGGDDLTPLESTMLWNIWKVIEGIRTGVPTVQQNTGTDASGKVVPFDNALTRVLGQAAADAAASRATDAANATAIAGLQAAVTALADTIKAGGGSVESAAIVDAVKTATDEVKALVEQRHQEVMAAAASDYELRVNALEAELGALRPKQQSS